MAAASA